MGQPQQRRLAPVIATRQIGQAPIVEAAAHPQASANIVKPHQWQQHQVQRPDSALPGEVGPRFENAEAVGFEFFPWPDALEHHFGSRPGTQHRQIRGLAPALCGTQQQARIDFTVGRQIKRDVSGAAEQRLLGQLLVQPASGLALLTGCQCAAGLAQHASKLRAGEQRRFGHEFGLRQYGYVKRTRKNADAGI
ncbi:hypothetical protein D9M71_486290 [compost metagenome]